MIVLIGNLGRDDGRMGCYSAYAVIRREGSVIQLDSGLATGPNYNRPDSDSALGVEVVGETRAFEPQRRGAGMRLGWVELNAPPGGRCQGPPKAWRNAHQH